MVSKGDEGRTRLRKDMGSRQEALIHICPNGETQYSESYITILLWGELRELKHLST